MTNYINLYSEFPLVWIKDTKTERAILEPRTHTVSSLIAVTKSLTKSIKFLILWRLKANGHTIAGERTINVYDVV